MRIVTAREQAEMLSSWHYAYDIQSPAPGQPIVPKGIPKTRTVSDPANDPAGYMSQRPVGYNDMVNNLVSHYHGSTDDEKKSGRMWYKAAYDLFHNFAKDNGVSPEKAVGYGAAFSPLTDWGDNVHHAQQFHFGYRPNDNPDHNEHDWQQAHIHPQALDQFRQQTGRDPSDSDEDLNTLADAHDGLFRQAKTGTAANDLNNPKTRANWIGNIQHKGIDATLADHNLQKENAKPGTTYAPVDAMRSSGIKTLGGNIKKAKDLYHAPDDVSKMFKVLGGPKISHFYDNILDDTPINKDGYYAHPNGDWTQNKDLGSTIDSHHIRAVTMPHGGWQRKGYAEKAGPGNPSSNAEYDVFNRGVYDATKHINSQEPDPSKHITPKQLQATVWLKHKNDKDYFERQRNPQTGQPIMHESELGGAGRPQDWQFAEKSYKSKGKGLGKGPSRAAALGPDDFRSMPPLWRKMFMSRKPEEWEDLLEAYVDHNSPDLPPEETDPHLAAFHHAEEFNLRRGPRAPSWQQYSTPAEGEGVDCPTCGFTVSPDELAEHHAINHSPAWEQSAGDTALIPPGQMWESGSEHNPMRRLNSILAYSRVVLDDTGSDDLWLL